MEHPQGSDKRGNRIIFLSHCILNQNAKVRGIARYPGSIVPLAELLLEQDVGIYQMPCLEMTYLGNMRWGQVKDQYNSPMFGRHCQRLAETIVDQAEDYRLCGYQILGFVMMDGSPACGLNRTPCPKDPELMWGGMGLKRGAMASSIGHDHHNIVVMGVDPEDMAFAANRVADMQGGIVLVENGQVVEEIAFPILGLLTDLDAWTLAEKRQSLLAKAAGMGCAVSDAFMFLSFVTLAAFPAFAVTDKGYVNVEEQKIIEPVLSYA